MAAAALLLGLAGPMLASGPATAEPPTDARRTSGLEPSGHPAPEAPVSTSPAPPPAPRDAAAVPNATPPPGELTRAAERRRLERLSPVAWLDRWGPVTIERRGE